MSKKPIKILAFSGSTRTKSLNKQLVKIAAIGAKKKGAKVTYIDLKNYPLPLYDEDIESSKGIPENALKLKKIFQDNDGFLIASPEYNSSYSAILKNTIDWVSRPASADDVPLSAFNGKTASIMSAAPGNLGGLRGLYQLRELLLNINIIVLPQMQAISQSFDAFTNDGMLKDPKLNVAIEKLGSQTVMAI